MENTIKTKGKRKFFIDEKGPHFKVRTLNTKYLKQFRHEASEKFQVWKKQNGYFLASNVIYMDGKPYAEETKFFSNYVDEAKNECDILRREYILMRARKEKSNKIIY